MKKQQRAELPPMPADVAERFETAVRRALGTPPVRGKAPASAKHPKRSKTSR